MKQVHSIKCSYVMEFQGQSYHFLLMVFYTDKQNPLKLHITTIMQKGYYQQLVQFCCIKVPNFQPKKTRIHWA